MNTRFAAILTLLVLLQPAAWARAQCADWLAGPLDNGGAANGADGPIYAAVTWDPDDTGPLAPRLVVGGAFTSIAGVSAQNIAQRDPLTGAWSPVGGGLLSAVFSLTVFNGQLFAGSGGDNNVGTFDITVHRWDGANWLDLPATNTGSVFAMTTYNGQLYIGGNFVTQFTTDTTALFIARWNQGANLWDRVENGFGYGTNSAVRALDVYGGDLYAGGYVSNMVDLAHWNPVNHWTHVVAGVDAGAIYSFAQFDGELILAGGFATINGVTRNSIAGWNGSAFHSFSTGVSGGVISRVGIVNGIVIGGTFTTASGLSASRIAFWPPGGSFWQPLGGGANGQVEDVAYLDGKLVAVGTFTATDVPANRISVWDGYQWGPFGGGSGNYVLAMANYNGRMVAGGDFHQSTATAQTAHNVAGWSGGAAQAFGTGMNGTVWTLKSFRYPGVFGSAELVAGGTFTRAGGITVSNVARWDERLAVFPPPAWQAMGAGFNNAVYTIERFNNDTYAGGAFTFSGATAVNYISRWDATNSVWVSMGGMNGYVYALKDFNGYLYAGGNFTSAGGVSTGGLARWNGSSWSAVGGFFLGTVLSLEVYNGQLVIGGQFTGINSSPNLAQYNGAAYSTFATGGANNNVRALRANGTRLYVGGDFTSLGGVPVQRLGYWDGSWHDTQYGADNIVYALGTFNNEVEVGGSFANVDYGGPGPALASPFWGRYTETGLPWFTTGPGSPAVAIGSDVSFSAQVAGGYGGVGLRWYHNNVPVNDGAAWWGTTISGATTPTLTLTHTGWPDAGGYQLVASNICGSVTSGTGTLSFTGVTGVSPGSPATTAFVTVGPNPTGDATSFAFSLARDADVQFRVYDMRGRLVRRVEAGRLSEGSHVTPWDVRDAGGRRVAAGFYFVNLRVDGRSVSTKQLTIVH